MKKLIILTSLVGLCAATSAFAASDAAQTEMKKMCDHHFKEMDTDKDGKVSKSEHDALAEKMFKEADANGDGTISKDEKEANFEKQLKKMESNS